MNLQLRTRIPEVRAWIERVLAEHRAAAQSVQSFGFARLAAFYPAEMLASTHVVVVPKIPMPPLTAMGLPELSDFENMTPDGMTYLDTFFLRQPYAANESVHFHELVHIAQWRHLGADRFLLAYAAAHLQSGGYDNNPLEVMAYDLQAIFDRQTESFDVTARVQRDLDALMPLLHA